MKSRKSKQNDGLVITFRPKPLVRYLSFGATILFCLLSYVSFSAGGEPWVFISLLLFAFMGVLGIVESFISRVELKAELLVVHSLFKKQTVNKADIDKIIVEKGCPVKVITRKQVNITLPELAMTPQQMKHEIQQWQKSG